MTRLAAILFLILAQCADAASWYLDPLAAGSNNGTSWANAWQNPTNIVWASVNAGDTVYISGGTTAQVYTDSLFMPSSKSGTAGSVITLSHSTDAGHSGLIIFTNCTLAPGSSSQNVWLNFAKDPAFVAPTNHDQVWTGSTAITNNCGLRICNLVGTTLSDTDPAVWYFSGDPAQNVRFSYIEISGLTNTAVTGATDWKGSVCYINFPNGESTNMVWEYCWFHDNVSQQFGGGNGTGATYDQWVFKLGIIERQGEDTFEEGGGWTIRDSVIGPRRSYFGHVHEDHWQFTGNYIKVYNNLIHAGGNSMLRLQTATDTNRHDFYFFNNIYSEIPLYDSLEGGVLTEPMTFVHFDPLHPVDHAIYSNIVVANNLWFGTMSNLDISPAELARNATISFSKGAATNCYLQNCLFVNNMWIDREKGPGGFPVTTNFIGETGYMPFTTNDFVLDYNVMANTNTTISFPRRVSYLDITTNAEFLGNYLRHNVTNYPALVAPLSGNFELLPNDVAALNKGTNLSALFNFDSLNRPRNVSGVWDIGPLELQDTNLICWITFDTSWTNWPNGRWDDQSGYGNHAYRWGNTNSVYPTNFPVQVYATNTAGANTNGYIAGDFKWYTNNYGIYGRWGDFGAITNVGMFTNLSTFTVMCWAHYANASRLGPYDYSVDANAALVSAGSSSAFIGSWDLGRFNQSIWLNNTRMIIVTNSNFGVAQVGSESDPVFGKAGRIVFNYPDNGFNNNGDSGAWHHYAFTFNAGVGKSYYDATNLATADISSVTTHVTVGWNNYLTATTAFIGIGCDTHGGDPLLGPWDDFYTGNTGLIAYPNNGFMDGQIDDVRIYNRTLSAAEIATIYSGVSQSESATTTATTTIGAGSTLFLGNGATIYFGK